MPYWSACLLNAFEDFSEGHEQKQSMERAGSTFVRDQLHIPISSLNFEVNHFLIFAQHLY